jgi:hypothetical protein
MIPEKNPLKKLPGEADDAYKSRIAALSPEVLEEARRLDEEEKAERLAKRKKAIEEALQEADLTEINGITAEQRRDGIKAILEEEDKETNDDIDALRKLAIKKLDYVEKEIEFKKKDRIEEEEEKNDRLRFHKEAREGTDAVSDQYNKLALLWKRTGLEKNTPFTDLSPAATRAVTAAYIAAKGAYKVAFALADVALAIPVAGPLILLGLILLFEDPSPDQVDFTKNTDKKRGSLKEHELNNQIKKLNDPTTAINDKLKFADQYKYHILKNELEVQKTLGASPEKIKEITGKMEAIRKTDDRFQNFSADWKVCLATSFNTPPFDAEPEKLLGNISETNQKILFDKAWEQNKDKLELITDPLNQFFNVKRLLKGEITLEALKADFKALPDGAEKEKKFFSSLLGLCNSYELEQMTKEKIVDDIKTKCKSNPKFKEGMQNLAMNNYVKSIEIQGQCLTKSGAAKILNALGNPTYLEKYIKDNPKAFETEFGEFAQEGVTETRRDGIKIIISNSNFKESMIDTLIHEGTHANLSTCSEKFRQKFEESVLGLEKEMQGKLQLKIEEKFPNFTGKPGPLSKKDIEAYLKSFGIMPGEVGYVEMVSKLEGIMNGTIPTIQNHRKHDVANQIPNIENDFFKIRALLYYPSENFQIPNPADPTEFIPNPLAGKMLKQMREFEAAMTKDDKDLLDIFTNTYINPAISSTYNYNDIHEKTEECVPRLNERLDRLLELMPNSKNVKDISQKCRDINAFAILTGIPLNERKWAGLGSHSHGATGNDLGSKPSVGDSFYPKEKQDASQLSQAFVDPDVQNGRSLNKKGQGWGDVHNEHKKALDSYGNQLAITY